MRHVLARTHTYKRAWKYSQMQCSDINMRMGKQRRQARDGLHVLKASIQIRDDESTSVGTTTFVSWNNTFSFFIFEHANSLFRWTLRQTVPVQVYVSHRLVLGGCANARVDMYHIGCSSTLHKSGLEKNGDTQSWRFVSPVPSCPWHQVLSR